MTYFRTGVISTVKLLCTFLVARDSSFTTWNFYFLPLTITPNFIFFGTRLTLALMARKLAKVIETVERFKTLISLARV